MNKLDASSINKINKPGMKETKQMKRGNEVNRRLTWAHAAVAIGRHEVATDAVLAAVGGRRAAASAPPVMFAVRPARRPRRPAAPPAVHHFAHKR